jgi:ABC-type transport system involved in multi-copper enzyme maturation permease subunit
MGAHTRRTRAIVRKELREYRRTRSVVGAMAVFPLIFVIQLLVALFGLNSSDASQLAQRHVLLYMLGVPALVPAALAAASIVGERQQGTLEPVLTTPIRREELVAAKALAPLIPGVAIAYAIYAVFLACVELFAAPGVAPALIRGPDLLAQLIFTPLLAAWSIWIAIVISARSSDIRAAQQLSIVASLPTVVVTTLIAVGTIHATLGLALGCGVALLLGNRLGWRIASASLDRERLVTGTRS